LRLGSEILVSKFAFKCNLYRYGVAVVMAAFRERTQAPHASMPLVRRVDILEERAECTAKIISNSSSKNNNDDNNNNSNNNNDSNNNSSNDNDNDNEDDDDDDDDADDNDGYALRLRRFFAENDSPQWVKKVSGGDFLRGTEQIEWSDAEGVMNMAGLHSSHRVMLQQ
jgi:hypothetical protein